MVPQHMSVIQYHGQNIHCVKHIIPSTVQITNKT